MGLLTGWRFCPRCRATLDGDDTRRDCAACGLVAYANPAPAASALVLDDDGRVLLARRAGAPFAGYWDVPGGFVDEYEDPLDALRRELREEAGIDVEPQEFVGAWADRYSEDEHGPGTLNLYWTARIVSGEPVPADDVTELRWFDLRDLPAPDDLAFRTHDALSAFRRQQEP